MTVQELIDELECCDGEAEVRFLGQPSWPFEYTIAAVVEATDRPDDLSGYRETPARRGRRLLVRRAPTRPTTTRERRPSVMAKQTPTKGEPAKQVAIDLHRKAGEPLHAKEIAKRVIASGRTRLKGKTPEATITAMLAVGSKPGGPFKRVDKGTYALADDARSNQEGQEQERETRPRSKKREAAKPAA